MRTDPNIIRQLILNRQAPAGIKIAQLNFADTAQAFTLPDDLQATRLILNGCANFTELPRGLKCYHLQMNGAGIRALPPDIRVEYKLELRDCKQLRALPPGLTVGYLDLAGCTALTNLPEGLRANYLDLSGCTALEQWSAQGQVQFGRLNVSGCRQLASLPDWLTHLAQLDLRDCERIVKLPDSLTIGSWLDLANTALTSVPSRLADVQLRWRGVPINPRIAFQPETITAAAILSERNVELRRVLLERCGYERFLQAAKAEKLDQDRDPGGVRRLLRVPLEHDEDLVCVAVYCPSTGRQYLIRVPPDTTTCHQAAAWIAGFDDPAQYHPRVET